MRKFKTMLLSAGIAAVLALGGAVGAHLTTSDAPMRTEAETTYVSDVLTSKNFDATSSQTYVDTTNVTGTSGVIYAANSARESDSSSGTAKYMIQLRSKKSSSGIVATTSDKIIDSVTVEWNKKTSSSRVLEIYGKNTPYTSPADLYDSATKGALLFKATFGNQPVKQSTFKSSTYIGIRSNDGALYLNSITIKYAEATAQNNLATFKGMIDKDIAYTDENRKQDTTNCYAHYDAAKKYFTETLTKEERISFMESTNYDNQVERFTHWAAVRGDSIVKDTTLGYKIVSGQKGLLTNDFFKDNTATIAIIVCVSALAITGIAIFAITRRKKLAK